MNLVIKYEDEAVLVVEKPVGLESQSARSFEPDMVSEVRKHLAALSTKMSTKCPQTYVGVVHRLDKPVSGIMVYAKTKEAAAALSKQIQDHRMKKIYKAVVCGKPVDNSGTFVDYLWKDGKTNTSKIVDKSVADSKKAELSYCVIGTKEEDGRILSLVEVYLKTGRHHQIRVQLAGHGLPLWGDKKYNENFQQDKSRTNVALSSCSLTFYHPVDGRELTFAMEPQGEIFGGFS